MIKIISIARLHPHSTPCKKFKKEKDEILNLWENLNNSQISKCIKVRKMFFSSCNERGIKKYSESPWGIDLRPSDLRSDAQPLSHKDSSVSEAYYEVLITRFPHTVRISNVDSVMFLIKKIVEMVSFELPRLSHARDKTKKSFSILHRAQNLPSLLFVSKTLRYQHCWLHPLSVQPISVGRGTNYVAVVVPPESLAFQECKTTWASRSSTQIFQ